MQTLTPPHPAWVPAAWVALTPTGHPNKVCRNEESESGCDSIPCTEMCTEMQRIHAQRCESKCRRVYRSVNRNANRNVGRLLCIGICTEMWTESRSRCRRKCGPRCVRKCGSKCEPKCGQTGGLTCRSKCDVTVNWVGRIASEIIKNIVVKWQHFGFLRETCSARAIWKTKNVSATNTSL